MKLLPFQPRSPIRSGESSEHLVRRILIENLDRLYSTAYRIIGRADMAEDLVQETARKALRASPALETERNVRGWIFTILVNTARDHIRRGGRESDAGGHGGQTELAGRLDVESITLAAAHDVRRAVADLPPAQRAVVVLVDIEEFTIGEAARMLELPQGTVASRLARAHQELRRFLEAYRSEASEGGGRQ